MIYPVHDRYGNRIGTIMPEGTSNPAERWVAYAVHDERRVFGSWDAARSWIEETAARSRSNAG